jgi:hypothetical protein
MTPLAALSSVSILVRVAGRILRVLLSITAAVT